MSRRYAILDDNQRDLEERLVALRRSLPALLSDKACAVGVIGSVAEGRARDDSDMDLVVVLREGMPKRSDYAWWDEHVAPHLAATGEARFPVSPLIIARESVATDEPHLYRALDQAIVLWDPDGILARRRAA